MLERDMVKLMCDCLSSVFKLRFNDDMAVEHM
jgi:hypothetical protein